MDILNHILSHTHFNFYSFGTLLVTIFTFLFAFFFLNLPNKSRSTFHLGLAFFFLFIFNMGYLFAAFYYHPSAAYHRWLTGVFVLPAILHFGQFFFHYPRNTHPKAAKMFLIGEYIVAILVGLFFCANTAGADKKFHFTGHYWDFDAEPVSKILALFIVLFSIVNFLLIGGWRSFTSKGKEKRVLLLMLFAMLVAAFVPNYTNLSSRDGALDRSTYLLSLVGSFVLGFFMISIVYINSTKDRTTFMAKIVSITLVTILMIMQALSFFTMRDQDDDYDNIKKEHLERIVMNHEYYKEVDYIIEMDDQTGKLIKTSYSDVLNLDLVLVEIDFKNTAIYDRIQKLVVGNFRENLQGILKNTHPSFYGYRMSLEDFLKENSHVTDLELKEKILKYMDQLNSLTYVASNKLSALGESHFCEDMNKYITSQKKLKFFREAIDQRLENCKWDKKDISAKELRSEINRYFRYFKPSLSRHYRKSSHEYNSQRHFVAYTNYNVYTHKITEVGFSYVGYRKHIHHLAATQQIILVIVIFAIFSLYPLFFRGSLINPLNELLGGVEKVNAGDLNVEVPVMVQDEIGFLADSFNNMVISIRLARSELQHYAETLEDKVKERTKEVQEKMDEVQNLKNQQDGDYYLTSLLAKPLFTNRNKSEYVKTDFLVVQKKKFQFRNRESELGGDICVTGNLRLGYKDNFKRYTFALNGDAMGKSMQGAGGSLVMGVVVNSILARSARNDWILDSTPEKWLTDLYYEINRIFKSFNGSMVISCVAMLIDDETGDTFYFNAEHPFSVLYRDGIATFIEKGLTLRKLGLDSEIPFEVHKTKLNPGDVVIVASDGRDDIDLTPGEPFRTINEDETLFLQFVNKAEAQIEGIYNAILNTGAITDDLSILRVSYNEVEASRKNTSLIQDNQLNEIDKIYERSRELIKENNFGEACRLLAIAYEKKPDHPKIAKLYGLVAFKSKDYARSVNVIKEYLVKDPLYADFWYYLGVGQKKLGHYSLAEEASTQLYNMQPDHVMNLLNIADVKRMLGQKEEALYFTKKALNIEPNNQTALRLEKILTLDDTKAKIRAIDSE